MSPLPAAGRARSAAGTPRLGLATRLILLTTLLTVVTVAVSFVAFGFEVRRLTRDWMARATARQQATIRRVETRRVTELLRASRLLTDSPTLRAALDTWRAETSSGGEPHPDLAATIAAETRRVAEMAGNDLLVLTDEDGRTLGAGGTPQARTAVPSGLGDLAVVRRALSPTAPLDAHNLDVVVLGGRHYRVGAVPVVLQGYVIGSMLLGDAVDAAFLQDWRDTAGGHVVLAVDGRVVGSSLGFREGRMLPPALAGVAPGNGAPVVRIGGHEYVAAAIDLGGGAGGGPRAYMLHSLTDALAGTTRSLATAALWICAIAGLVAGAAAWHVSRSLLEPFRRFVRFMGSVAVRGDWSRRFSAGRGGSEVTQLADACNALIASLERHEQAVRERAREDVERMERLKESEKLAELGRMLAGAAHEINNPLTGVVGRIEMLLGDRALSPAVRERLQRVHGEGRRVIALVRRLLHLAHGDTGEAEVVDLARVAREVTGLRRHDFVAAGIDLRLEGADSPLAVRASEIDMHQLLVNVVGNGFDALSGLSKPRALTVRLGGAAEHALLEFEDDGAGMERPDRVFDFFFTTKPVGKGTGLGLAICRAIVQRAGGQMTAENRVEGGARFVVRLPRCPDEAVDEAVAGAVPDTAPVNRPAGIESTVGPGIATVAAAPGERESLAGVLALLVDDEPSVRELERDILHARGATVVEAASGREALSRLAGSEPAVNLIVSDLRMPGEVSGEGLLEWVRANRPGLLSRFLFVTGGSVDEACFLETCGVRHLFKPFTIQEFHRAIDDLLAARPVAG